MGNPRERCRFCGDLVEHPCTRSGSPDECRYTDRSLIEGVRASIVERLRWSGQDAMTKHLSLGMATLHGEAADTIEQLLAALKIFLGENDRFQVAVGGNPIAVDRMLEAAQAVVAKAEGRQ